MLGPVILDFCKGIEKITWRYSLKPDNLFVKPYKDTADGISILEIKKLEKEEILHGKNGNWKVSLMW